MASAASRWWWPAAVVLLLAGLGGTVAGAPLGTSITYQGVLELDGAPANGVYDLRFGLYTEAEGGSALATVEVEDVTVTEGAVAAAPDFGDHFDGGALWLEIEVRDAESTEPYELLSPRQELQPQAASVYAMTADHAHVAADATTAADASALDGLDGDGLRSWTGVTGVPPDWSDGDADLMASLGCSPGEVAVAGAGGWHCGSDAGGDRTMVVGPVGDPAANGAALLAAMAGLPTPSAEDEAWIVELEPGTYDLGGDALQLEPWVGLVGSGQASTVITSSHCTPPEGEGATLVGAAGAVVRDLTVVNTCGSGTENGVAIRLRDGDEAAAIVHVTATASGISSYSGAVASSAEGVQIHRVTATAGGSPSVNVAIVCAGSAIITDSSGTASGGVLAVGLAIGSPSAAELTKAVVSRGTYTASSATTQRGILVSSASADLELVTVSGTTGVMVDSDFGDNDVHATRLVSTGPVDLDLDGGTLAVTVTQSRVMAAGPTITSAGMAGGIHVAATQLWGGAATAAATCAGVWDEGWVFYPSTCP